jgi:hypothetical protein
VWFYTLFTEGVAPHVNFGEWAKAKIQSLVKLVLGIATVIHIIVAGLYQAPEYAFVSMVFIPYFFGIIIFQMELSRYGLQSVMNVLSNFMNRHKTGSNTTHSPDE